MSHGAINREPRFKVRKRFQDELEAFRISQKVQNSLPLEAARENPGGMLKSASDFVPPAYGC
jgi:hypothetical protein